MLRLAVFVLAFLMSASFASSGETPAVLRVASREIPTRFSPSGPLTDADRQALDLIFEPLVARLVDSNGVLHDRPALAESLLAGQGTHLSFQLRPGAVWSNGEPVTANDVRHTLRHLREDGGAELAWETLVGNPQLGSSPREVRIDLRHGLVDPLSLFSFPILPQIFQGRDLVSQSDPEFSKSPIGSGPFVLSGPVKKNASMSMLVFRKNPHHVHAAKIPFDEIHWFAVPDGKSPNGFKADLTLGLDGPQRKTVLTSRVWYIAPNHRHPLLQKAELRRFLALALERDKIVGSSPRLSALSLTPRGSWTQAPSPRVPDDLHLPVIAQGLGKALAKQHKEISLSFKFPADRTATMSQVIDQWHVAAQACGLNLKIQPLPLGDRELADAIARHDFDLALVFEDHGDSLARLSALFDRRPRSLAPGGSNFMGVQDKDLRDLLDAMPLTRQFPALRSKMQNLHVHLVQSMPLIPLWQHQARFSLDGYRAGSFDPLRPFANLAEWRK